MPSLRTPYQILNLSPDAEPVVIEAAYRALIKKYHPDLWVGDPNAQSRAASINRAFATLRDPDGKAACDREMRAWRNAVHTPPLQPVHPRPKGRGLWWAGWAAAALIALVQFLPWQKLAPEEKRAVAMAEEAPADRTVLASDAALEALVAAPPAGLPAAADLALQLPSDRIESGGGAVLPQPEVRDHVARMQARPAPLVRERAARPRAAPVRSRRPAARQPAAEKEFLEREGYIY